jgi:hypothetical protein
LQPTYEMKRNYRCVQIFAKSPIDRPCTN